MENNFEQATGVVPFETNTQANAMMVMGEDERFIADLTAERTTMYCSMTPQTEEEEIVLFNAMNNPEQRIGDCINMEIKVQHVFCEVVTCRNDKTGEEDTCPRIVLIDDKGIGYQAVSLGVFSAIKKIFQVKGLPHTWKKPLKLKVVQVTKGDRKLLTFNMVK